MGLTAFFMLRLNANLVNIDAEGNGNTCHPGAW